MSFTNQSVECPICFECIGEKNNITTECGHKFHASCLMTNITRNGFGCPCCRALMAEHPEEEDDESGSEYSDDDTATLLDDHIIDGPFSDDALRGLRLLTNLLEGNEHDQADVLAEYDYVLPEEDEEEEAHPIPSREFVTRSLQEQGVTYEQLAAWILMDHEEYESQYEEIENFSGDLWGKLRVMITNYRPAEPEAPAEEAPAAEDITEPAE